MNNESIFNFFKKFKRLQPEEYYVITLTSESLMVTHPKHGVEQIQWAAIEKIELVTTDEGPWLPDVWLVLSGGGDICSIPQGASHYEEVYDKVSALPGFDFEAVLSAMTSTDNARFVLWRKSLNT